MKPETKSETKSETTPETKPVGPAVQVLIDQVKSRFSAEVEQLAVIALKDAKLDPADGWRFDFFNAQYVHVTSAPAGTE
jgi:hypothetical protein